MTTRTRTPATEASVLPEPTGRRLVELVIITAPAVMIRRSDYKTIPPDNADLDEMLRQGAILPPTIKPEVADHLVSTGLATRVTVRL